mgnify:CR=1 FL=1
MPRSTSSNIFWVYVLVSLKDSKRYIGYTEDINKRLKQHNNGEVISTKNRTPFKLIYLEGCLNQEDALRREGYLKKTGGNIFLAKRLKSYYAT